MVATTSGAFLGLTVGCARCHDHKFDPVSQTDYFRVAAAFAGVQHGERALRRPDEPDREKRAEEARRSLAALDVKLDALQPIARPDSRDARPPVSPLRNVERFEPV